MKQLKLKGLDLGSAQPLTKESMRKIFGGSSSLTICPGGVCRLNSDCAQGCICNEARGICVLP